MSTFENTNQSGSEKFILVQNPINNEIEEVVLDEDNTLKLSTLDHAFPGAYGLRYNKNGEQYAVRFNDKIDFLAPFDGWKGKVFTIIFKDHYKMKIPNDQINGKVCTSKTSKSVPEKNDIEIQFVVVLDPCNNEPIEFPLNKDGTLSIHVLDRKFRGAHCLEYKNEKTGRKRFVLYDDRKSAFLAPSGGWGERGYILTCRGYLFLNFILLYFMSAYYLNNPCGPPVLGNKVFLLIQILFNFKRVRVHDPVTNTSVWIPPSDDGTLPITKLNSERSDVYGLKYKNPMNGRQYSVKFDEEKKAFLAPSNGWGLREYTIVYKGYF
ncbi:TDP43_N domain-containing protein [Meloidogyne graminicola]|uniref:TDP43_N domain-containing protein n=1 Tax=Meloidogyne graminicola TaxID=189291 RepID=A0A8S9ZKY0_9BILA|nr:TDP43_N domain-containing protein [Meloidogyne graminicola]